MICFILKSFWKIRKKLMRSLVVRRSFQIVILFFFICSLFFLWTNFQENQKKIVWQQNIIYSKKKQESQENEVFEEWRVDLPWFMKGGKRRPVPGSVSSASLWPQQVNFPMDDRILDQLMFIPQASQNENELQQKIIQKEKSILLVKWPSYWKMKEGNSEFAHCPVNNCIVSQQVNMAHSANLIIFNHEYVPLNYYRYMDQFWMMFYAESPFHTEKIPEGINFNWTVTYRADSDIPHPYGKWVYYDPNVKEFAMVENQNRAVNKTKKVAWFVSNCSAKNNRLEYAKELQNHIEVDIYGKCGYFSCPRTNEFDCFQMLHYRYKFYLSFENSNCRDYITEKFFRNSLGHDVIPIVMGAHPDDYARAAPEGSYIHVDDFESPKALAEYLHQLDKDDDAYNAYFRWKGTGEFINTFFFCRVCAMLHDPSAPVKADRDINAWWRGKGVCTKGSWREQNKPDIFVWD